MHGTMDYDINRKVMNSSWPRCSENKDWDRALKYRLAEGKIDEYLTKLKTKLMKSDDKNEDLIKINKIVSDMSKFLKN